MAQDLELLKNLRWPRTWRSRSRRSRRCRCCRKTPGRRSGGRSESLSGTATASNGLVVSSGEIVATGTDSLVDRTFIFGGDNRMFMSPSPVQNGSNLILLPSTLQRRQNALKALSIPPWPPSTVALQPSRNAAAGSAVSVWQSPPRPSALFCMFAAWAVPSAPPRETDACSVIKPSQNSWKSISPAQQSLVWHNGKTQLFRARMQPHRCHQCR